MAEGYICLPAGDVSPILKEIAAELQQYRTIVRPDQLLSLKNRLLDTKLLEQANLPRLSLFYLSTGSTTSASAALRVVRDRKRNTIDPGVL